MPEKFQLSLVALVGGVTTVCEKLIAAIIAAISENSILFMILSDNHFTCLSIALVEVDARTQLSLHATAVEVVES